MDFLFNLLFEDTPLWVSIATFFIGWSFGWFTRGAIAGLSSERKVSLESIIQFSVVSIWIFATFRAAIFDAPYPPLFVNLMFGAVAGSLNGKMGKGITEILKNFKR